MVEQPYSVVQLPCGWWAIVHTSRQITISAWCRKSTAMRIYNRYYKQEERV